MNYYLNPTEPEPTFAFDPEEPTKYTEALSFCIHKLLYEYFITNGVPVEYLDYNDFSDMDSTVSALRGYCTSSQWQERQAFKNQTEMPASPAFPGVVDAERPTPALFRAEMQGFASIANELIGVVSGMVELFTSRLDTVSGKMISALDRFADERIIEIATDTGKIKFYADGHMAEEYDS